MASRSAIQVDEELLQIATALMDKNTLEANKCEIHLAVDFQGWMPDQTFSKDFKSTSSRRSHFQGLDNIDFSFYGATHVYGNMETYTAGSRNNLQMCLYNKTKEAKQNQRLDYYVDHWKNNTGYDLYSDSPEIPSFVYNPALPVFRLEVRIHHKVMSQFAEGIVNSETGETAIYDFSNLESVSPHLSGLWNMP